jgi:hypothetical protein
VASSFSSSIPDNFKILVSQPFFASPVAEFTKALASPPYPRILFLLLFR